MKLTPIKALRRLTGIIKEDQAINILVYCNMLARWLDKDELLERDFLLDTFARIGVELELEER